MSGVSPTVCLDHFTVKIHLGRPQHSLSTSKQLLNLLLLNMCRLPRTTFSKREKYKFSRNLKPWCDFKTLFWQGNFCSLHSLLWTGYPVWGNLLSKCAKLGYIYRLQNCNETDDASLREVKWKSLSRVWLFATPWTIQSMKFSKPTGVHSLSFLQGVFPSQVTNQVSRVVGGYFTTEPQGKRGGLKNEVGVHHGELGSICTPRESLLYTGLWRSESWGSRPLQTASPGHGTLCLALGLTNRKQRQKNGRQKRKVNTFIRPPPLTLSFFFQGLHLFAKVILTGGPFSSAPGLTQAPLTLFPTFAYTGGIGPVGENSVLQKIFWGNWWSLWKIQWN